MNKEHFESFQRGMAQARAYLDEDAREGYVAHEPVDVRRVRARTKLTRQRFASIYGLDSRTVEQWEQGRRKPDRTSETYLRLIESDPEKVAEMVGHLPRG